VAFNSLKLRLDSQLESWQIAIDTFAKHDVILLSEVPGSAALYRARVLKMLELLNKDGADWSVESSHPSGPGVNRCLEPPHHNPDTACSHLRRCAFWHASASSTRAGNPEVHVIFAKKPVRICAVGTIAEICGVSMDHAPIVATLEDTRFLGEVRKLNIVGVHAPPQGDSKRRSSRDEQISVLLRDYPRLSQLRLQQPFTSKAARELRKRHNHVAHVICGDFNADALELRELGADTNGWDIQLGSVRTSSGGRSYDNFLVNRDAKDHFTLGARVLDLAEPANFAKGVQGISDHRCRFLACSRGAHPCRGVASRADRLLTKLPFANAQSDCLAAPRSSAAGTAAAAGAGASSR
jgi:hypothetical protein